MYKVTKLILVIADLAKAVSFVCLDSALAFIKLKFSVLALLATYGFGSYRSSHKLWLGGIFNGSLLLGLPCIFSRVCFYKYFGSTAHKNNYELSNKL